MEGRSRPELCCLSQNCGRMLNNPPFAFLPLISRPYKGGPCGVGCVCTSGLLWHSPSAPGMGFSSPQQPGLLCPWSCGESFFNSQCSSPPAWDGLAMGSHSIQLFVRLDTALFAGLQVKAQLIYARINVRNACPPHPLFICTNYASWNLLVQNSLACLKIYIPEDNQGDTWALLTHSPAKTSCVVPRARCSAEAN